MRARSLLLALPLALVAVAGCSSGDPSPATPESDTSARPPASTTAVATTAGEDTSSGSTTATSSPPSAPGSTTTVTPDPAAVDLASRYFENLGLPLSPDEAACLGAMFDATAQASLADALDSGAEPNEATQSAVFRAIVTCEPQTYAEAQIEAIVSLGSTSEADAACIVEANNQLLRNDEELLALASGDLAPSEWPEEPKAKLRESLLGCVPAEVADRIIAG